MKFCIMHFTSSLLRFVSPKILLPEFLYGGCCGRFGMALVFIVIGRRCSEGCGFDSHCRPGSFLRFNSRHIMYSAVGSLVLSCSWTPQPEFISFWCLWIQLCNNHGQRLCAYNLP